MCKTFYLSSVVLMEAFTNLNKTTTNKFCLHSADFAKLKSLKKKGERRGGERRGGHRRGGEFLVPK